MRRLFLSCLVLMALTGAGTALWGQAVGFAYVANCGAGCGAGIGPANVSAYSINPTTGALTPVAGSPFPAESRPFSVTVHPTSHFAYVANNGPNTVSAYSINPTTGALTPVAGSPFPAGIGPTSVTVDPTGKFAYVANFSGGLPGNVSAYTINGTTGALTLVAGSPFPAGANPNSVTVDPTGQFAYVANSGSDNVSAYAIDGITGALTLVGTFPAGGTPLSVTVDPTGQFAYVANEGTTTVSAYAIDGITGALTPVAGSPFLSPPLPHSVTVHPAGQFAYVANESGNVSAYAIDGITGALTPVAGSPFPAGTFPISVTVDPTGQFAYVANRDPNNVSAYSINGTTGALTPVAGSPFPAGSLPLSVSVKVKALKRYQITVTSTPVVGETNSVVSGQTAQVQVQAIDNFESVFSDYRGTVHFSSGDITATLPVDYTFSAADSGSHTFNITLKNVAGTSATRDLTVQDTLLGVQSIQDIFVWFNVIATREGLVGGTTACGHVIIANDHFVALPSTGLCNLGVRLANGSLKLNQSVLDVGPWCPHSSPTPGNPCVCPNDPYWQTTGVPFAATNPCSSNGSGIDLADGTFADVGNPTTIFWRFQ